MGLVAPRASTTLAGFLDAHIAGRTGLKERTRTNLRIGRDRLVAFFGAGRALRSITTADADAFLQHLQAEYATATAARTFKWARQFFKAAARADLVGKNPFTEVKAPGQTNRARQVFVSREDAQRVLDACPDTEWRLIVALARYGGLRCPSEHYGLLWAEVDWDRGRFLVNSPKTEHLDGRESRWVPIFPELRPYLEEAFDLAEDGAVHVITRHRLEGENLRTTFNKIVRRADLTP